MDDETPEPDAPNGFDADEVDLDDYEGFDEDELGRPQDDVPGEPPHPVNWNLLSAHDLEQEWLELNRWVDWLRHTYGLGDPAVLAPPRRTPLGALRSSPALAVCLRP